jgi:hypothetical protein
MRGGQRPLPHGSPFRSRCCPRGGGLAYSSVAPVVTAGSDDGGAELDGADAVGLGVNELCAVGDPVPPGSDCFVGSFGFFALWSPALSVLPATDVSVGAVAPESAVAGDVSWFDLLWSGEVDVGAGVLPSAGVLPVVSPAPPATSPRAAATPSDSAATRGEIAPRFMPSAFPLTGPSHREDSPLRSPATDVEIAATTPTER